MITIEKLALTVNKYRRYARYNYYVAYFIYFLAFSASAVGALLAFKFDVSRSVLAAISVIPSIAMLLTNIFKFSERAHWHYEKKNRLNALLRLAEASAPNVSVVELAEKWNAIDESMEKKWPSFGGISGPRYKG